MKETIIILANKYPNPIEPTTNMFIQQLAWQFCDLNFNTIVICPLPTNLNKKFKSISEEKTETTENGGLVKIFHPKYISFGQSGVFFQKLRVALTTKNYEKAVKKILTKYSIKPSYIYSYFLCPTSVVAAKLSKKLNIPSFMEHGEAIYTGNSKYGNKKLRKIFKSLSGAVAVSNQNKNYLINAKILEAKKIVVYPNCFRKERFKKISKSVARKHFGWNENQFIVGFAGSFDERKGILRVEKAVDMLDGVYCAFAGKGALIPKSKKCIYAQPVNHCDLIYFYNALDVFVLPTTAEGSCTATAEAIGCGCPIISSNREFNENLCDFTNSLLVEPEDINNIAIKIKTLFENRKLLNSLSDGSVKKSKTLNQEERMKNVVKFMKEQSHITGVK